MAQKASYYWKDTQPAVYVNRNSSIYENGLNLNMSTTRESRILAKEIFGFILRMKEVEKIEKLQKQDVVQRYVLDRNTKSQINEALEFLEENEIIVIESNDDITLLKKSENIHIEPDMLLDELVAIKLVTITYGFKEQLIAINYINKEEIEFTVCKVRYKAYLTNNNKLTDLKIIEQ